MLFRIFVEPQQGCTYERLLDLALAAEHLGFNGLFVSDHYMAEGQQVGVPGPLDALVTLAGLARDTKTIRFGTLVSPVTFRLPGPLAVSISEIDAMSGGRVELGLGAGWYESEHQAYGIPFPPLAERFEHLEEQLSIITGLWRTPQGQRFRFHGKHYHLLDSPALPKPVQSGGPPLIVGGRGRSNAPQLAARFAREYNVPLASIDLAAELFKRVNTECERRDRDPRNLICSVAVSVCCWTTRTEMRHRVDTARNGAATMRDPGLFGTPEQIVEGIHRYRAAGAQHFYFHLLNLWDFDHLSLLAKEVVSCLS
jgi:F420-dependent oxidoreductase-like protein